MLEERLLEERLLEERLLEERLLEESWHIFRIRAIEITMSGSTQKICSDTFLKK